MVFRADDQDLDYSDRRRPRCIVPFPSVKSSKECYATAVINPVEIPDDEKAARMAAERTRKLREKEGLFAEFIELVTAEQIQEAARRHWERFQAALESLEAKGKSFREQVRAQVTAEAFAAMDERFAMTPGTPEYLADFWRHELQRVSSVS